MTEEQRAKVLAERAAKEALVKPHTEKLMHLVRLNCGASGAAKAVLKAIHTDSTAMVLGDLHGMDREYREAALALMQIHFLGGGVGYHGLPFSQEDKAILFGDQ